MSEKTVTEQVIEDDNKSDVVTSGLENKEIVDGADVDATDGDTDAPVKSDANIAKSEFKLRSEKRKRKEAEDELATLKASQEQPKEEKPMMPLSVNFESDDDYNTALSDYHEKLTDYKISQRDTTNKAIEKQSTHYESLRELDTKYQEQCETAIDKYDDFIAIENEVKKQFDPIITEAILKSENPAEVVYYIGTHPEALETLQGATPVDIVKNIGKIEKKLNTVNKKVVSDAPNPIDHIQNGEDMLQKDPSKMNMNEWMAWDKKEQIKKIKNKMESGVF